MKKFFCAPARTGDGGEDHTNHFWWQEKFYRLEDEDESEAGPEDIKGNWYPDATPGSHQVQDASEVTVGGVTYKVDGHDVQLSYSPHEKEIAELLEREVGGELYMLPRVNNPQGVKTADYLFHGERYDLKSPTGRGKNTLYDALAGREDQAENFIFNLTECPLSDEEINRQLSVIFGSGHRKFVQLVVVVKDGAIRRVLRRKKGVDRSPAAHGGFRGPRPTPTTVYPNSNDLSTSAPEESGENDGGVDASKFPPLSVTGIGLVDGLLGANCRHSKGPGDGVHNPFEHFDSEENRRRELLDQRQRLLERRIRKTRREVMTLQEAIDKAPDDATRAELEAAHRKKALQLQRQEDAYDAFCKEHDLRKLYDRLEVARYGPKQAKAAAEAAKPPANSADGGSNGFTKSKNIDIIQGERVPNSITAATPQQKLQGYLLNSNHPRGKDKARVFNSVLGYHYENWDKLSDKFFDGLQTSVVASVEKTRYGIKYKVPMRIVGERGKSMVVNTVWQLDNGSTITRLVTATFDKRTIRKEANDAEIV